MDFKKVPAPPDGAAVVVKRPVASPDPDVLKPLNYFVDHDGSLQAYAYTASDQVPDLSDHPAFVDESCRLVSEQNLQQKFGLKPKSEREKISFTEFGFPTERSTIMIPSDAAASTKTTLPPVNLNCAAHCFYSYCPHCSHAYCDHGFHLPRRPAW